MREEGIITHYRREVTCGDLGEGQQEVWWEVSCHQDRKKKIYKGDEEEQRKRRKSIKEYKGRTDINRCTRPNEAVHVVNLLL